MTKSHWKMLISIFSVFAIMLVAVACGDDDDDDDDDTTGGTTPGATTAVQAPSGTITIHATQYDNWDPHHAHFAQDITHFFMVWRGLYHLDTSNKPQPMMADGAPKVSSDGKVYTVKLKSGLKWSDGNPIVADDFAYGVLRTCNPDNAGEYQYLISAIKGCDAYFSANKDKKTDAEKAELLKAVGAKAIDASTVEYTLTDAQSSFPVLMSLWMMMPIPTHKLGKTDLNVKWPGPLENVYNGPFMPKAYTEKDRMELVPNPNWSGEKVKIEKLVLRYIDDAAVANNAYRTGELDSALANASELDKLKTEFPKELHIYPATRTIGWEFNMKDPVLGQKLDVRLAIARATDRATMMKVVFKDGNVPTTSWMPEPTSKTKLGTYDSVLGFDAAKAKEHMTKAGYPDGKDFPKLTLLLTDTATNKALGEFAKSEFKKYLNIDITLEFTDSKTRSGRFSSGDYQMVAGGWQEDYPDPENWFLGLWETGSSGNNTFTSIPALDALIAKAKFNTNDEQRRQQYRDAEKILLENGGGIIPFYHSLVKMLVKPHIKGMLENKRAGDTFAPGDWDTEKWSTTKK